MDWMRVLILVTLIVLCWGAAWCFYPARMGTVGVCGILGAILLIVLVVYVINRLGGL